MKFRKKPVIVEAIQYIGTNRLECEIFLKDSLRYCIDKDKVDLKNIHIETLEGTMKASINDWIIKGVHGEFYPCKPDIFKKTYEKCGTNCDEPKIRTRVFFPQRKQKDVE